MTAFLGVLVTIGMVLLGAVMLVVASIGAMVGFGIALVVMPWLVPLMAYLLRKKRKDGREHASMVEYRGDRLPRAGRGPIPAH